MTETSKETKAQRAERLKGALNPWSAYAEIERFAREGCDSIPPEWLNTYFRWWGVYTQGDGVGAVGGTGGEGKAVPYLHGAHPHPERSSAAAQTAARSPISPSGTRAASPTSRCARTSSCTGCGSRICPTSSRALSRGRHHHAGLLRRRHPQRHRLPGGRSGRRRDRGRLAARPGRDGHAQRQPGVLQPAAQVQDLHHRLPRLVLLPRDQRRGAHGRPTSVHGRDRLLGARGRRALDRSAPGTAARRLRALGAGAPGGQGRDEIFRDSDVLRENRRRRVSSSSSSSTAGRRSASRPSSSGASARSSTRRCPRSAGRRLPRPRRYPSAEAGRPGLCRCRCAARPADVTAARAPPQACRALRLGRPAHHGDAELLVLERTARLAHELARELEALGLRIDASPFWRGTIACTGSEFCKIALTETKGFARRLVADLESRLPGFEQHSRST